MNGATLLLGCLNGATLIHIFVTFTKSKVAN